MSEIRPGSIVTVPGWKHYGIVVQRDSSDGTYQVCDVDVMSWDCWVDPSILTLVLPPLAEGRPAAPVVDDAERERARRELWSVSATNGLVLCQSQWAAGPGAIAETVATLADAMLAEFDKRFGQPDVRKDGE